MKIVRMNDFRADPAQLVEAEIDAAARVIRSGWYVLGRELERFEGLWRERCDGAHTVGVGNGMDAIEIGLRASGIKPGDEVITVAMTAFASTLAIIRAGATPVLADIDPDTALLDPQSVLRCLSPRTRGVLLVHLYGRVGDMRAWRELCDSHGLLLFEDCAQAHGARWEGRAAGTFGAFGAYSFYPTKNLGALGDGGAIVTSDEQIAERCRVLRNYGQTERYHHPRLGLNSRLDEIHAAMLTERLAWLDRFTERRRAIANQYFAQIRNPAVRLLAPPDHASSHVHHLFVVTCVDREALAEHLRARDIETLKHYPIAIHEQESCRNLRCDPAGLARSEAHARQCLSIPCHPNMTDEEVERVIEAVNDFRR